MKQEHTKKADRTNRKRVVVCVHEGTRRVVLFPSFEMGFLGSLEGYARVLGWCTLVYARYGGAYTGEACSLRLCRNGPDGVY